MDGDTYDQYTKAAKAMNERFLRYREYSERGIFFVRNEIVII